MENKFKPDYLCDNPKCRQVTNDLVIEFNQEFAKLETKLKRYEDALLKIGDMENSERMRDIANEALDQKEE